MRVAYIIFVIGCISCQSASNEIVDKFKTADSSLQHSEKNLEESNKQLQAILKDSSFTQLNTVADSLGTFIESLKERIKKLSTKNDNVADEGNFWPCTKVMIEEKNAERLFSKIETFQELCIARGIADSTEAKLNDLFGGYRQNKRIGETIFQKLPVFAALTLLSKFQLDAGTSTHIIANDLVK